MTINMSSFVKYLFKLFAHFVFGCECVCVCVFIEVGDPYTF